MRRNMGNRGFRSCRRHQNNARRHLGSFWGRGQSGRKDLGHSDSVGPLGFFDALFDSHIRDGLPD